MTPNSAPSSLSPAPATTEKSARPGWTRDTLWDADKGTFKPEAEQYYRDLETFKATEDSRRLTLPASPDAYKPALPKDFTPPQGIEYAVDPAHPLMAQARAFAHKNGLSQEGFEQLLSLHAAQEIGTIATLKQARDAEVAKLGAAGSQRVTAVENFLKAQLGEELGAHMATMLVTSRHVEGYEKLMSAFRGASGGSFSPSRSAPEGGNGKIPGYDSMTFEQRRQAQDRANAGSAR